MKKTVVALVLAGLASAVFAQQPLKPEEMIKFRKSGYSFMSWNMGKIKAQVIDGKEPYDQAKVAAAANAIAAIANSGMGALYSPDTTSAQLGKQTRLKPEFFDNLEEAGRIGGEFVKHANQLASVAAGNDQAAIKKAFGDVGGSCKSCHDKFRAD